MKIDRQKQVTKLKENVSQLTENLQNLRIELDLLERTIEAESLANSPSDSQDFKVNESLEITNKYKGKKGTIGKVVSFTKNRCTIVDQYGIFHTRAKTNFRRSSPLSK